MLQCLKNIALNYELSIHSAAKTFIYETQRLQSNSSIHPALYIEISAFSS